MISNQCPLPVVFRGSVGVVALRVTVPEASSSMPQVLRDCPVTPLLRCDPRMGATTVSSMGCHIWRRARNIPPGSNPSSNRGWPIIRNVTHIHGSCSALQNTYISSLGHDDASSVSFDWANACAVLPRPVSGLDQLERAARAVAHAALQAPERLPSAHGHTAVEIWATTTYAAFAGGHVSWLISGTGCVLHVRNHRRINLKVLAEVFRQGTRLGTVAILRTHCFNVRICVEAERA